MADIKSGWIVPWLVFRCLDEYYLRDSVKPIPYPVGTASVQVVADDSGIVVRIHPDEMDRVLIVENPEWIQEGNFIKVTLQSTESIPSPTDRRLEQRLAFIDQIRGYSPKAANYLESLPIKEENR